jgi:hypothetical protein
MMKNQSPRARFRSSHPLRSILTLYILCSISLRQVHAACSMSMLRIIHSAFPCCTHLHVTCPYSMSMYMPHVLTAASPCFMHVMSYPISPVMAILFCQSSSAFLSRSAFPSVLSCYGCPILPVLSWLSSRVWCV